MLRKPCILKQAAKKNQNGATPESKKPKAVEEEVAEELALSDWDLEDLEPEWRAEDFDYPLLGLLPYGFLPEDQRKPDAPKTFSLPKVEPASTTEPALAVKFMSMTGRDKRERITRLSLVDVETGMTRWNYPMCVATRRARH